MKFFKPLRIRFALWIFGLLAAALVLFGALLYINLASGLFASIDDSLRLSSAQAIAAMNIENGQINFANSLPEQDASFSDLDQRGLTLRFLTTSGQLIQAFGPYQNLTATSGDVQVANRNQAVFSTQSPHPGEPAVRIYTAPITDNGQIIGIIQIIESLATVQESLNRLLFALLISIPCILILASLGGYFLATRALSPVDQITQMAQRISVEDLSGRLNLPDNEDEISRLANTFDSMLSRLEAAFKRERQFTMDASHELRTPLAAIQVILGVTLEKGRSSQEYQQSLLDISEETDRLQSLVENLLFFARGNSYVLLHNSPVNLSHLLADAGESVHPLAEVKGILFKSSIEEDLVIQGNTDRLIRLFINLLDNAIKYTKQGEILLTAKREGKTIQVMVTDTGVGISKDDLPNIFDRFYRARASRSVPGIGLGLSIAQEIVREHQGEIKVESGLGQGTTFKVIFLTDAHGCER